MTSLPNLPKSNCTAVAASQIADPVLRAVLAGQWGPWSGDHEPHYSPDQVAAARAAIAAAREVTDEMMARAVRAMVGVPDDYPPELIDPDYWSMARDALEAALSTSDQAGEGS